MQWFAHFVIGALIAGMLFYFLGNSAYTIAIYSLFAGACALVPDLDKEESKARRTLDLLVIFSAFILVYLAYCQSPVCVFSLEFAARFLGLLGLYFLVMMLFKPRHRGIVHSIIAAIVFSLAVLLILGLGFGIAAFIGYASHLLADRELKLL